MAAAHAAVTAAGAETLTGRIAAARPLTGHTVALACAIATTLDVNQATGLNGDVGRLDGQGGRHRTVVGDMAQLTIAGESKVVEGQRFLEGQGRAG